MSLRACLFCRFFDADGKRGGLCRLTAPMANIEVPTHTAIWPTVEESDWCGDFKRRRDPAMVGQAEGEVVNS